MGGKRNLAKRIIPLINATPHLTYAEPFIGMGGIFLRRNVRPRAEVINDLSGDLSTFFRVLQRHYVAFLDMMRFQITTRQEFDRLVRTDPETLTDLERSARFLYLQRTTYGGLRRGVFAVRPQQAAPFDVTKLQPMLEELHGRLAGVTIERLPFQVMMEKYDRAGTLFFVDPPYWGVEGLYGKDLFQRADFETLREILRCLKGRFILTINDREETRDLFAAFTQYPVAVRYSVKDKTGRELIVTNEPYSQAVARLLSGNSSG